MGIGMALMEHTVYDHREWRHYHQQSGGLRPCLNADVMPLTFHFIDKPDPYIDPVALERAGPARSPVWHSPAIAMRSTMPRANVSVSCHHARQAALRA